jgi:hypothetical protein
MSGRGRSTAQLSTEEAGNNRDNSHVGVARDANDPVPGRGLSERAPTCRLRPPPEEW